MVTNTESEDSTLASDKWALEHIDLNQAHLIQEAFDNDTSGFITIKEVNKFTKLRPLDWRYFLYLSCQPECES